MNGAPAVEVKGLVKKFGGFAAVDDVSFAVEPGELFGFLGPNGAGKTTTISILCTLLRPSGGSARVAGYDVVQDPGAVRSSIGLVFQELTLDDYLTGSENLKFHAVLYGCHPGQVRERAAPLLEMVGLTDRADQQVRFYSGGMKRRLEIARGLLHAPKVLFLDEPTIGLDPQTRVHIWDYIDTLRHREATTMFLTTHYMDEAERCDRIAIIDQGRIVAIDTPDALKASIGDDVVTVTTSDDAAALVDIARGLDVKGEQTDEGLRLLVPAGEEFVPRLFEHVAGTITSVSVRRPSLDDVFLEYTGRDIRDAEAGANDQWKNSGMTRGFRGELMADAAVPGAVPAKATVEVDREGPLVRNVRAMLMVWRRDIIRLFRMPTRIISGLAQPLLFLFVLGAGLENAIGTQGAAGVDYQQYLFPGILAMSVLTSAPFSAIAIVWDREFGFMREMLVAPVTRGTLVFGKALGGGSVAVVQGLVLVVAAPFVGVSFTVASFLQMVGFLLLLAFSLTAFGIVIASRMQRMESFQMVMALVLQPMLFLSGAIFPLENLPSWLAVITRLNPATYGVDVIRRVVLPEAQPLTIFDWVVPLWADALITFGFGVAMLSVAVRLFGKTE